MTDPALLVLLAVTAALYSAAGQGGGSGYLAVMGLAGVAPAVMKPTALLLNVGVTLLALIISGGLRRIPRATFLPCLVASVPAAALGGAVPLADEIYRWLVAGALIVAALPLFREPDPERGPPSPPAPTVMAGVGLVLGWLSGATGIGGGVFLAPLLLHLRWADLATTLAASSIFILVNSTAALIGHGLAGGIWPVSLPLMLAAALVGALLGVRVGRRYLGGRGIRWLLGGVLLVASVRLVLENL